MEEIIFASGSVPVAVAARVYGKDASWIRAGIVSGWLPIGKATRSGKLVTNLEEIPDLLILFNDKWAALECKQHAGAKKQPNQEYYVGKMDEMSFSRFICPENKEEVLHDLQQSFQS